MISFLSLFFSGNQLSSDLSRLPVDEKSAKLVEDKADELKLADLQKRKVERFNAPSDSRCYIEADRGMQMIIKPRTAARAQR